MAGPLKLADESIIKEFVSPMKARRKKLPATKLLPEEPMAKSEKLTLEFEAGHVNCAQLNEGGGVAGALLMVSKAGELVTTPAAFWTTTM